MTDSTDTVGTGPEWITAGDYQLALTADGVIARNAKGRALKTVPAKAKKTPEYEQLEALESFYAQHDRLCLDTVTGWFLTAKPVGAGLVAAVWDDPAWQSCLRDLLVDVGDAASGGTPVTGLLRDARLGAADGGDPVAGAELTIVDLDGETVTASGDAVIAHPAVVEDLADWREFIVELGATQRIDQILRTVHPVPQDAAARKEVLGQFADGTYSRAAHLLGRARGAGYTATFDGVRVTTVTGDTETVGEMAITAWEPTEEAELGELTFWREGSQVDPVSGDIDPVAWSETVRMGEFLYAGRTIKDDDEAGR